MARRYRDPFYGVRFIGDTANEVVHDCDNEVRGAEGCGISTILREDGVAYETATEAQAAIAAGFARCPHCLGENDPDDARPGRFSSLGAKPTLP